MKLIVFTAIGLVIAGGICLDCKLEFTGTVLVLSGIVLAVFAPLIEMLSE